MLSVSFAMHDGIGATATQQSDKPADYGVASVTNTQQAWNRTPTVSMFAPPRCFGCVNRARRTTSDLDGGRQGMEKMPARAATGLGLRPEAGKVDRAQRGDGPRISSPETS